MKLIEATDDQKTVRLGIVKLGTAVGKVSALGPISKIILFLNKTNVNFFLVFLDEVCTD